MSNLRNYATVTGAYWVFTLTDGAVRMLVLLFLYQELQKTPLEIASLFLFYEFFGIVTNFLAGWIGARFGLKTTLLLGLSLQIVACSLLGYLDRSLTLAAAMFAQALNGIAKDLTKMSSKSYVKFVVKEGDQRGLMKWVAILTGSKNALKGVGFFLGGLLLTVLGFQQANYAMAGALAIAWVAAVAMLPRQLGKASTKPKLASLLSHSREVNWLSAARFFLFGSRDIWFVLALPLFLSASLGWSHAQVGGFLALWVIGYGIVQSLVPSFVKAGAEAEVEVESEVESEVHTKGQAEGEAETAAAGPLTLSRSLGRWTQSLLLPLAAIVAALYWNAPVAASITIGLAIFGIVFAINSAIHSYLIVAYAEGDKVAMNVGFYYMANAGGRFAGTVLSGALFQWGGLGQDGLIVCILGSAVFVLVSRVLCVPLARSDS